MEKTREVLRDRSPLEQAEDAAAHATDAGKNPGGSIVGAVQSARDVASQALRSASDKASSVATTTKETASSALEYGKEKFASIAGSNGDKGPEHKNDEVDLTPEEQLTRHHVELDTEKLPSHHHVSQLRGPLQQLKEKAAQAADAARSMLHALKNSGLEEDHPIPNEVNANKDNTSERAHNTREGGRKPPDVSDTEGVPWGGPPVPATQKNIRGQQDDRTPPAGPDSKEVPWGGPPVPSTQGTEASMKVGMNELTRPENDFPETLQDAINGAGINKDPDPEPEVGEENKTKKEGEDNGVDGEGSGANPDPFGLTSGARSKL